MPRTVIELGDDQKDSLERLAKRLGRSQADVVRSGISLFRTAMREAEKGNDIGVVTDGRVVSRLQGLWSEIQPVTA